MASGIEVCGKPLYRTTTHLIVNVANGRIQSQHRSEKAAEGGMRLNRGSLQFNRGELRILPLDEAIARVKGDQNG